MGDKNDRTLFCGNLSEKVTEELLYELFLQAGPLESVKIPKDKTSGRQKNFGFVVFKHQVSVPYTVALFQGLALYGRELQLDYRTGTGSVNNPYLQAVMAQRSANQRGGGIAGHSRTSSLPEGSVAQNSLRGFTTPIRESPHNFNPHPPVNRTGFPQPYRTREQSMPAPNFVDSRMFQQYGYLPCTPPLSRRMPGHDYRNLSSRGRQYH